MPARIKLNRGERYGRLRYICDAPAKGPQRCALWRCDCGVRFIAIINNVRKGDTRSCGCLQVDRSTTHGFTARYPVLYRRWHAMHSRCYNQNDYYYTEYGGRGITVVAEWHGANGLEAFIAWALANGFDPVLQLDRIHNTRGYGPGNCHWTTAAANTNNRRNTVRIRHPVTGKMIAFADYWREVPRMVSYTTASHRLKRGWPVNRLDGTLRKEMVNEREGGMVAADS